MPGAIEFERRKHFGGYDSIAINFSAGEESGVKGFGDKSAPENSNLRWQRGIDRSLQGPGIQSRDYIGVSALAERVNSRIRSASAVDSGGVSGYTFERGFDLILNRVFLRLALPPGKVGAVVS